MATQMTSARRGIATDEMKQVAKDEDVTLDWLISKIASGSIIIPSNNVRKEKIHNVGIGKGMKTKVNVNIGTSTLNVNLEEEVEKAMENAGSLEMAFLEKNMIWLNTVITVAPMIGFTGTVVGMISAFDAIKAANDISPAVVAGGISQALLTTAFGLIVAMIIQFFQNFFVSRIDQLILDMEENSVKLLDSLHTQKK